MPFSFFLSFLENGLCKMRKFFFYCVFGPLFFFFFLCFAANFFHFHFFLTHFENVCYQQWCVKRWSKPLFPTINFVPDARLVFSLPEMDFKWSFLASCNLWAFTMIWKRFMFMLHVHFTEILTMNLSQQFILFVQNVKGRGMGCV